MAKTIKRRAVAAVTIVVSFVLVTTVPAWTQTLGEAARQERERKKAESAREHHVYTNEDLAKAQILVPDDQARVLARKNGESPAIEASLPQTPAIPVNLPAALPRAQVAEKGVPVPAPVPAAPEAVVNAANPSISWPTLTAKPAVAALNSRPPQPLIAAPTINASVSNIESVTTLGVEQPVLSLAPAFANSDWTVVATARTSRAAVPMAPAIQPAAARDRDVLIPTFAVPQNISRPTAAAMISSTPAVSTTRDARRQQPVPPAPAVQTVAQDAAAPVSTLLGVQNTVPGLASAMKGSAAAMVATARGSSLQPQALVPPAIHPAAPALESLVPKANVGMPAASVMGAPMTVKAAVKEVVAPPPPVRPAECSACGGPKIVTLVSVTTNVQPVKSLAVVEHRVVGRPVAEERTSPDRKIVESNDRTAISSRRNVKVEHGDSLWKLAEHYLGRGERWRELAKLNPHLLNPGLIRVGEWLRVPADGPQEAREIVVHPGDTLWSVAETALGSPLAFNCIAHANPKIQSADVIRAGETLVVPEACAVAR